MNRLEMRRQRLRLEVLVMNVMGQDQAFLGHVRSLQESQGRPVAVNVRHVGNSLVIRIYPLADASNVSVLPDRKIESFDPLADSPETSHWFGINSKGLYLIDTPTHSQIPLRTREIMTCHHPLVEEVDRMETDLALAAVVGEN